MLVLARREQERIIIDGRITITVVRVCAGGERKVRIGIDAPPGMTIDREEVYWSKLEGRRRGAPPPPSPQEGGPADATTDDR